MEYVKILMHINKSMAINKKISFLWHSLTDILYFIKQEVIV